MERASWAVSEEKSRVIRTSERDADQASIEGCSSGSDDRHRKDVLVCRGIQEGRRAELELRTIPSTFSGRLNGFQFGQARPFEKDSVAVITSSATASPYARADTRASIRQVDARRGSSMKPVRTFKVHPSRIRMMIWESRSSRTSSNLAAVLNCAERSYSWKTTIWQPLAACCKGATCG